MKRIDLLLRKALSHSYEGYFGCCFLKLCEQYGLDCRIHYLLEGNFSKFLTEIQEDPPHVTMSFKEICIASPNSLLCDELQIPHFFWMGPYISSAFYYLKSSYGIVGCQDVLQAHILKQLGGKKLFNLPALILNEPSKAQVDKRYETVFFGSLYDLDDFLIERQDLYSEPEFTLLKRAIEILNIDSLLPIEALIMALEAKKVNVAEISFAELLYQLEEYVRAKEVSRWIHSFKNRSLHVFGWHRGKNLLKKISSSVHLHSAVYFTERIKILNMSKYALFSHCLTPQAVDPLFLQAIVSECIPLSVKTPYMEDHFSEFTVEGPAYFEGKIDELKQDAKKRASLLEQGQNKIREKYSSEKIMKQLLTTLPNFI